MFSSIWVVEALRLPHKGLISKPNGVLTSLATGTVAYQCEMHFKGQYSEGGLHCCSVLR